MKESIADNESLGKQLGFAILGSHL
jgi:hypothetical protein